MANYIIVGGQLCHSDALYHHGIKGMKWGVRRFQNKDGSLKPAGRKRYSDDVYEKKAAYKSAKLKRKLADNEAFSRYEKSIASIEKNYKRGQNLSDRDQKRELAAEQRYQAETAKNKAALNSAKSAYKQSKKDYDNSAEGKAAAAERRKKALKIGAAVAGTALAAYGAYKLNDYVKTKNCQIAAKRGHDFAVERYRKELASEWTREIMPEAISEKISMQSNSGHKGVSAYREASNDSFAKAAKNVIDYKKSGGNLKKLHGLGFYELIGDGESIVFEKKRKS